MIILPDILEKIKTIEFVKRLVVGRVKGKDGMNRQNINKCTSVLRDGGEEAVYVGTAGVTGILHTFYSILL